MRLITIVACILVSALFVGCGDDSETGDESDGVTDGATDVAADVTDDGADGSECADNGDCSHTGVCEDGACVDKSLCDVSTDGCTECTDMADCGPFEVCDDESERCVSNGLCMPLFSGWFINADGVCEEIEKSGCVNPIPYKPLEQCKIANGEAIDTCPDLLEPLLDGDVVAAVQLSCEYGEECCCDECYSATVCTAEAGSFVTCFATEACLAPGCACAENEDCEKVDACVEGFCELACGTVRCAPNYECVHGACLPIDEEARECVVAGGSWRKFSDTCVDACGAGPACGDAETMGCDCGKSACWDGVKCAKSLEGDACEVDLDCVDGSVCEADADAKLVCARGCHEDEQCDIGQTCDTSINCLVPPCPGQCTGRVGGGLQ